jgi:hypothetical protein
MKSELFEETYMIIDCDRCQVRGAACGDCVVGVFLGVPGVRTSEATHQGQPSGARAVQLDAPEYHALNVLAEEGLVPRLRLVASDGDDLSPTASRPEGFSNAG